MAREVLKFSYFIVQNEMTKNLFTRKILSFDLAVNKKNYSPEMAFILKKNVFPIGVLISRNYVESCFVFFSSYEKENRVDIFSDEGYFLNNYKDKDRIIIRYTSEMIDVKFYKREIKK